MYELITDKRYFKIGVTYYVKDMYNKYIKFKYHARLKSQSEEDYYYYKKTLAYRFEKKMLFRKVK